MQFTRTLPKELVHRAAVAEVFLTDMEYHGEDELLLGAQLPRRHAFYHDTLGPRDRHDPLLLLEVCRQGIFVVAHRCFDVPLGYKFLLRTVEFEVPHASALTMGDGPTEAVITTHVEHRFRVRTGVTGLRLRFALAIGPQVALLARIGYSWMRPEDWTGLRAGQRGALGLPDGPVALPGPRVAAALVGRRDPANTVISPPRATGDGGRTARLTADTGHPTLYDHWVDHVPGMLELEAFRQLALTAAVAAGTVRTPTVLPLGLAARFRCFAEMDLPLECRTAPVRPGADIECTLRQPGAVAAEARIRLADPDLDPAGLAGAAAAARGAA
ncbi:A-factor biosynthesis hotdog protein [Streptomyces puniciscabiei]|uniref:A-factor biosynthesis hotdog protein n=1 Tax=Streptomyces puniciscabiei TaxID=164348 RepID=A0A542SWY1_9ACTN|nr:ScbA/BarX family gamma-butyrolactone biosynthesis protein [Streptomyces puniciscabiei]TQK79120.1 A-factor biosynthesis hotdog protein [Streptomyces puniciscabiei]